MRSRALSLGLQSFLPERLLIGRASEHARIIRDALCYDAENNRYSIVPHAIAPNMVYSMELGARVLVHAWPFFSGRLLDVGCGKKPYSLFIESLVNQYIGLDLPKFEDGTQSDIYGDGQILPFKMDSFDTVLCTDVLNELPSPIHFFREANRVLKRDGHLILMASNDFNSMEKRPVYAHYTAEGLRLFAEECGFNIIVLRSKGRVLPFVFNLGVQIVYRLAQKIFGSSADGTAWRDRDSFWFNRGMVLLQKILLKLTPSRSVDSSVEWIEGKEPRIISENFHIGYLMVAKKVFNLD